MSNWARKIKREKLKLVVSEFKKEAGLSTGGMNKLITSETGGRRIKSLRDKAYALILIAMKRESEARKQEASSEVEVE